MRCSHGDSPTFHYCARGHCAGATMPQCRPRNSPERHQIAYEKRKRTALPKQSSRQVSSNDRTGAQQRQAPTARADLDTYDGGGKYLSCARLSDKARPAFCLRKKITNVLFHHRAKRRDNSAGVANQALAFIPIMDYAGKCRGF
jgi:hypothetical protein